MARGEPLGQAIAGESRRYRSGEEFVSIWADGIHVNVRLKDEGNQKQGLLVLMGATAEGRKELIAVVAGFRGSKQSWQELLLDLKQRGLTKPPKLAVGACCRSRRRVPNSGRAAPSHGRGRRGCLRSSPPT